MRIAVLALGLAIAAGACASSGTAAGDQTVLEQRAARVQERERVQGPIPVPDRRFPTAGSSSDTATTPGMASMSDTFARQLTATI